MSLEDQVTRVSQGMKDTLKTLINKLGGNVTDELIDQYPVLASALDDVDPAGSAQQALNDAKSYTDQKISEIPTPDVSGQIGEHNTDSNAHTDIRSVISNHTSDTSAHVTDDERTAWNAKADAPFKPSGKSYLTFSSPSSFTLSVFNTAKNWDGTLEYFSDDNQWATWDGTTTLSSGKNDGEHAIYLRGAGNTIITGEPSGNRRWRLEGTNIACIGNIETLLDYETVESGSNPIMQMACYAGMFFNCTSLTQAPVLPAITLADYCYDFMFYGCTSLTQAPALPAATLANYCYKYMFYGCTGLIQAPALPATTLANQCYQYMFYGCTSLTQAPALPATTLANYCYEYMFQGCIKIKLSATKTDEYTQVYRIPMSGNGTTAISVFSNMFASTGGTFTGTPEINTTYYLSNTNTIVREGPVVSVNGKVGDVTITASELGAASATDLQTHTGNADIHVTADEKAQWNESDVLIAEANVTTFDEIKTAIEAGKKVVCKWSPSSGDTVIAELSEYVTNTPEMAIFSVWYDPSGGMEIRLYQVVCANGYGWIVNYGTEFTLDEVNSHLLNDDNHVTIEEKTAWNAKLDSYTETDPTVPDWAKADSKPSYTAEEVGADPSGSADQALVDAKSYTDTEIAAIPAPVTIRRW